MEHVIDLPTGEVAVSTRGSGSPVVVLQRDLIPPTPNPLLARLEDRHTIHVVDLPGFGGSARPPWLRTVTQVATIIGHVLDRFELEPCPILGLGFGGWVAADLVTQAPSRFSELVLISPWGVKPSSGEIADYALFDLAEWAALGFHDHDCYIASCGEPTEYEVMRSWDNARESVMAVAWKPIGHSRPLAAMLPLVRMPTLVAWGTEDHIVPPSCLSDWTAAMPHAETAVFPDAGHHLDFEAAQELSEAVTKFISANEGSR
jgi:pimeloyl-ACP methyl ester carboxylesterase